MNLIEFVTKVAGNVKLSAITEKIDCLSFNCTPEFCNLIGRLQTRLYVNYDNDTSQTIIIGSNNLFLQTILNFSVDFTMHLNGGHELCGYCIIEPSQAIEFSTVEDCLKEQISNLFTFYELPNIELDYVQVTNELPTIQITKFID